VTFETIEGPKGLHAANIHAVASDGEVLEAVAQPIMERAASLAT
ncbi:MAG: hypothetical protein ACI95C_001395, partial [Pseudohongiellaceae bacterium]